MDYSYMRFTHFLQSYSKVFPYLRSNKIELNFILGILALVNIHNVKKIKMAVIKKKFRGFENICNSYQWS